MFTSKILFLGFGSVGQAVAPLLCAHWNLSPSQIQAIAADAEGERAASEMGIRFSVQPIVPENLDSILNARLTAGDLLINVSVDVSSTALIEWCQANDVLYLDTCVEPWKGGYLAEGRSVAETTNYALRQAALQLRGTGKPTAVIAHGANPGIISHLAKAGLLEMAAYRGLTLGEGPNAWGELSQALHVKVIHIAERDTQHANEVPPADTFVNTWSAEGLLSEAWQSAECGWGTHEEIMPAGAGQHTYGSRSGIYLAEHSAAVKVQSWVPSVGPQNSYLITHHEALSLAELLTVPARNEGVQSPQYRPTVYYAYTPCQETGKALEAWIANDYLDPAKKKVLRDELVAGEDELGVLFIYDGGAFWYGSTVGLRQARAWTPYCNATSLQVVGGILGALDWMIANPSQGVVEAEDLPHTEILRVAIPYLGRVQGHWTTWQPENKEKLVNPSKLQFSDFRV